MPEVKADKGDGMLILRLMLLFVAAWVLMLTEARIQKDTGLFGGNFSYLGSLGVVFTIWLVKMVTASWKVMTSS